MRALNITALLIMDIAMVFIGLGPASALGQKSPRPTRLSETDLLTYLPHGAKLADIPFVQFGPSEETKKTRPNVLYADVDADRQAEIIVAYYTPPHDYIINGQAQEGFFRRAHVKVLDWNGQNYMEQWDSGGWGSEFRAGMGAKVSSREQQLYTDNYFSVADINNDGIPEILFTRTSFLAEGAEFQAFSWNGKTYEAIALASNKVRIVDTDNDGVKEIVSEYDPKGIKLASPRVLKWNGKTYRMAGEHPEGRIKVSARTVLFLAMLLAISIIGLILLTKKKAYVSRG